MLLTFSGNNNGLGIACIMIGKVDMIMDASITHGGVGVDPGAIFTVTWTLGALHTDWCLLRTKKSFFSMFGGWCTVASPRDFTSMSILYVSK